MGLVVATGLVPEDDEDEDDDDTGEAGAGWEWLAPLPMTVLNLKHSTQMVECSHKWELSHTTTLQASDVHFFAFIYKIVSQGFLLTHWNKIAVAHSWNIIKVWFTAVAYNDPGLSVLFCLLIPTYDVLIYFDDFIHQYKTIGSYHIHVLSYQIMSKTKNVYN